jgi:two-component system sensor histidine kinase UhpB
MSVIAGTPAEHPAGETAQPKAQAEQGLGPMPSIRQQILLGFAVIAMIAQTIGGTVIFLNAQVSTRVEIEAAQDMAERLVHRAILHLQGSNDPENALTALTFNLSKIRHVRLWVEDLNGMRLMSKQDATALPPHHDNAPEWFLQLLSDVAEDRAIPIVVGDERIGTVVVASEAGDEVAEIWGDVALLAVITLLTDLVMLLLLYLAIGRILAPLTELAQGMRDLENHRYRIKRPRPRMQELAAITDRFNALADALARSRENNEVLSRRLITAQDEERRHTAKELHDEVGPCLFGLRANLGSIEKLATQLPQEQGQQLAARSSEMGDLINRLQSLNRGILERLRPMALGHMPITEILEKLVSEFAGRYPNIEFSLSLHSLAESYEDCIELTLYRCIQECLTNAVRHAEPNKVVVSVGEIRSGVWPDSATEIPFLTVSVQDNGIGLDPKAERGRGLLGMEERVHMLGGRCSFRRLANGSEMRFELSAGSKQHNLDPLAVNG